MQTRTMPGWLHISQRGGERAVQAVLSKYGMQYPHPPRHSRRRQHGCSPSGLLLIDVFGPELEEFYQELTALDGVDVQRMDFED